MPLQLEYPTCYLHLYIVLRARKGSTGRTGLCACSSGSFPDPGDPPVAQRSSTKGHRGRNSSCSTTRHVTPLRAQAHTHAARGMAALLVALALHPQKARLPSYTSWVNRRSLQFPLLAASGVSASHSRRSTHLSPPSTGAETKHWIQSRGGAMLGAVGA